MQGQYVLVYTEHDPKSSLEKSFQVYVNCLGHCNEIHRNTRNAGCYIVEERMRKMGEWEWNSA